MKQIDRDNLNYIRRLIYKILNSSFQRQANTSPMIFHNKLLFILLALSCRLASSVTTCGLVQFSDYSFDLSSLTYPDSYTFQLNDNSSVFLSPCFPQNNYCPGDNTSQTFMRRFVPGATDACKKYTINQTIATNYMYIDINNPSTGISINFSSIVLPAPPNPSAMTINIYSSDLNIYCNSLTTGPTSCSYFVDSYLNTTTNITTNRNRVGCKIYHAAGCPYITRSNFWQFLVNNSIWFAITLWVFALFELLLGYVAIRATIMVYGIMTGSIFGVVFTALSYVDFISANSGYAINVLIVVLSILMGVLFGFVLLTMPKLGHINIGIWVAVIFTLLLQNSALYATGTMIGFYITLGVSGFLMILMALLALKNFIVISTAFTASFWIIRPLGFFLPYYPNQLQSQLLFTINSKTPWQFYLYLGAILVITILGAAFQFCILRKKGKDQGNKNYYLEEEGTLKEKMMKLLEFKEIKNLIKAGKDQVMFLKNLVVEESQQENPKNKKIIQKNKSKYHEQEQDEDESQQPRQIEMKKIETKSKKRHQIRQTSNKNEQKMKINEKNSKINDSRSNKVNEIKSSNAKTSMKNSKERPPQKNSSQEKSKIKNQPASFLKLKKAISEESEEENSKKSSNSSEDEDFKKVTVTKRSNQKK